MSATEQRDYQQNQPEAINAEKRTMGIDFQQLLEKSIDGWYWIVLCAAIALGIAYLYLKKTPNTYQVQSSILIKDESNDVFKDQGALNSRSSFSSVFSVANNFSTEMDIIASRTLIRKVIENLDLYITQRRTDTFCPRDLYKDSPIKVWMTPTEAEKLQRMSMLIKLHTNGSLDITTRPEGAKDDVTKHYTKLPVMFPTSAGTISITRVDSVPLKEDMEITASIFAPTIMAGTYKARLGVTQVNKESFITSLTLNDTRPERAIVFINALVEAYNADANEDKNQIAERTADFINNRIVLISNELGNTETTLAAFKQNAGLTDLKSDADQALKGRSEYEKNLAQNETQLHLIQYLHSHVKSNIKKNDVLPTSIGIENDYGLMGMINEYNKAVIERNRLARNSSERNPVIANTDVQLQQMRDNIETTLASLEEGVSIAKNKLETELASFISTIERSPEDEKQYLSITRQRDFQSQLYLLLLQKREENAIKLAATANNGRIIEEPEMVSTVAPRRAVIMLIALVIGLAIPIGIFYLMLLLAVKVAGRSDIKRITDLPVIGDIPFNKQNKKSRAIVVQENKNNVMDEAFRSLRTNIQFMLRGDKGKVIMFTSAISGEGKSTIAGNLAASYAFLGKKVVIVGLDIRKPGLNKVFHISTHLGGISQYLADPEGQDLMELVQQSDISPNLYILPGGIVPPNPTELLSQKALDQAIDILRQEFDIIIIDTAPVGMVSDSQVISRVADMTIVVVRQNYSYKNSLYLIDDMARDKVLPSVGLVLNAVNIEKRRGYGYGYGHGYGHGYGYGYGHAYGYGYGQNEEKKKKGIFGRFKSLF
ncbi:MAG: polysaccharide biosynthesis tyrosine autokinase [Bacteroidaceae bacterium]|nr:polysaccharide biosynthesis tyrosine autokinase [Bacteroidaceae bacterium]